MTKKDLFRRIEDIIVTKKRRSRKQLVEDVRAEINVFLNELVDEVVDKLRKAGQGLS